MADDNDGNGPRILTFDEVRQRLGRHWDWLAHLPHRALRRYLQRAAGLVAQPSRRFRSTIIQEIMVDDARRTFTQDVVLARGRWLLRAASDLVLQFKKVNSKGRSSNYPTAGALDFVTQLELPNMPRGTRVTLGYRLNRLGTEVAAVRLVAVDGSFMLWNEEIVASNQGTLALPVPGLGTAAPTRRLRARPDAIAARRLKAKPTKANKKRTKKLGV
jgi:hypothetical protein